MSSTIKRNLGGPLSAVFFANLSGVSQDQIGYTPKLLGPGRDLWVPPSDILIGKVATKPPFTERVNLARTHHWIIEVGDRYLKQITDIYAQELEDALAEKERVMTEEARLAIRNAVQENRTIINQMNKEETELLINNLKETFTKIITDVMESMTNEFNNKLEKELKAKEQVLNKQLHAAVKAREEYLHHEYSFLLEWQANVCFEESQRKLKQSQKEWFNLFEEAQEKFECNLAKTKATMESEHSNILLELHHKHLWDCQAAKQEMQLVFKNWYMKEFKKELTSRDFIIIDLEKSLEMKKQDISTHSSKIKDLYTQFQKFINFALKAKPGQAEFLLSLELLLKEDWTNICGQLNLTQENLPTETDLIAKSILEHMLKNIFNQKELEDILFGPKETEKQTENFAQEIEVERVANRALKIVGENLSPAGSEDRFKKKRLESLKVIFARHPSLCQFFQDTEPTSNLNLTS